MSTGSLPPGSELTGSLLTGTFGARSAAELLAVLGREPAALCDLVELRLDLLETPDPPVEALVTAAPGPALVTCRPPREGGAFAGSEEARLALLARAADAGAAWVDIEWDVPTSALPQVLRRPAPDLRIVRSAHIESVPCDEELRTWTARLRADGAVGKLIAQSGGVDDALRLLHAVRAAAGGLDGLGGLVGHVVAQPFSRFAGAALGAPITYAALAPGGNLGLPLPTVATALDTYRFRRIHPGARLFLLLGTDVTASVSPVMLDAVFAERAPDIVALPWSVDDPLAAVRAIREFGWAGAAVTMPHKRTVYDWLRGGGGELADSAREVGSVNTVVLADGVLHGHNTDVAGVLGALASARDAGSRVGGAAVVLGAGGAARAAIVAARQLGLRPLVWARRTAQAEALAAAAGATALATLDAVAAAEPELVIDATPGGPPGGEPLIDPATLPGHTVFLDMLVSAQETALVCAARRVGRIAAPGFDMLAAQALEQLVLLGVDRATDALPLLARAGGEALQRRARHVTLLGLRWTGKSTLAPLVGELLGRPVLDTDAEVTRRVGRSPEQLIAAGEESRFRAVEHAVLVDALRVGARIVACGGGVALHEQALRELAAVSIVVLLDAPDEVLLERRSASPRAALSTMSPADELAAQRAARMPLYEELADVRFPPAADGLADGGAALLDPTRLAERIAERVELRLASLAADD